MYSHEQSYAILYQHSQQLQWLLQFGCQCCSSSQFLNLTYFCCCCWPVTRASVFMFFASPHNWVLYARVFFAYFPVFSLVLHTIIRENSTVDSVCWAPCFFFLLSFISCVRALSLYPYGRFLSSVILLHRARFFAVHFLCLRSLFILLFISWFFFLSLSCLSFMSAVLFYVLYVQHWHIFSGMHFNVYWEPYAIAYFSHDHVFKLNNKWKLQMKKCIGWGGLLPSIV